MKIGHNGQSLELVKENENHMGHQIHEWTFNKVV